MGSKRLNKVGQLFFCSILAISLLVSSPAKAGPAEDFQEARLIYLTAVASMAVYPDKGGGILLGAMGHNGWTVEPYTQKDSNAQARFLLANNVSLDGSIEFVLAIAGSHTVKDW